jgi:hypothetical protein
MGATSFSVTAIIQDVVQAADPAQQQTLANVTPVNANQAQAVPAPADTVTLTNQAAEGQQAGPDTNRGHFDRAAFLGAAGYFFGANARPNRYAPENALPVLLKQPEAQNACAATGNGAASTANVAANAAASTTPATAPEANGKFTIPQQQLQQLQQTLQRLGVNPQSIPLFNRMAMLLYADDPAALHLLIQALQTRTSQAGSGQLAASANTDQAAAQVLRPTLANQGQTAQQLAASAPAPAQTQPDAQPQAQAQGQTGQSTPQIEVLAAQINFTEVQATVARAQTPANQPSAAAPANTQAGQKNSALTVQIEELQVAFQPVEVQPSPLQLNGSSAPVGFGTALNVTA